MQETNWIVSSINTVGFPIFACGALGWYVVKVQSKLTEALNNNTAALRKLVEKIDNGKES